MDHIKNLIDEYIRSEYDEKKNDDEISLIYNTLGDNQIEMNNENTDLSNNTKIKINIILFDQEYNTNFNSLSRLQQELVGHLFPHRLRFKKSKSNSKKSKSKKSKSKKSKSKKSKSKKFF
jgi:TPP-dependent trihydroxycyclohexane-1,2-dione (THcHDO) dehydratase